MIKGRRFQDRRMNPQLRKSNQEHKPNTRYPSSEYILLTNGGGEPESFQEAQTHKDKGSWMKVMSI